MTYLATPCHRINTHTHTKVFLRADLSNSKRIIKILIDDCINSVVSHDQVHKLFDLLVIIMQRINVMLINMKKDTILHLHIT